MPWVERRPQFVAGLQRAAERCKTKVCRDLIGGYVRQMQGAGVAVPRKSSLDLDPFAARLPDIVLLAISRPDRAIFRIAGERVRAQAGRDVRDLNYYDLVPAFRRRYAAAAMEMVIGQPCAFRADILQTYSDGTVLDVESLGLPLASDEVGVDGFIMFGTGAVTADDESVPGDRHIVGSNITGRELIDIGYGVDETFIDLVYER